MFRLNQIVFFFSRVSAQPASWESTHICGQQQRRCSHTWHNCVWNHIPKPWANVLTWNRHVQSTYYRSLPVCVDAGLRTWAIFSPVEERTGSGSVTAAEHEVIRTCYSHLPSTAATRWRGPARTSAGNTEAQEATGEHFCWTSAPKDHMSTRSHLKERKEKKRKKKPHMGWQISIFWEQHFFFFKLLITD